MACYTGTDITQSFTQAKYYWEKAAEQDYIDAIYKLGDLYKNGEGVCRDLTKAYELYRKAEELNKDVFIICEPISAKAE